MSAQRRLRDAGDTQAARGQHEVVHPGAAVEHARHAQRLVRRDDHGVRRAEQPVVLHALPRRGCAVAARDADALVELEAALAPALEIDAAVFPRKREIGLALVRGDVFDGEAGHVALFLKYAAYANSTLFLFNLLPVPILDGWSVAALFFPAMLKLTASAAGHLSWIILVLLVATPLGNFVWGYGDLFGSLLLRLGAALFGHG